MLQKTKAIVLHTIKYGDNSLIVDTFTKDYGKVSFSVKLSQSRKSTLRRSLFQPLSILNIEFDNRPTVELHRLKSVQLAYAYASLPFHPVKDAVGIFLSEFLSRALMNEDVNEPLFAFLESSFMWFDCAESGIANFHLVFLMRLTRFLGVYPNVEDYSEGCLFDMRNSMFTSVIPLHSDVLRPKDASLVCLFLRMNYENMHAYVMNRSDRKYCLEVIIRYYRLHIPDMPDLKSLDVLSEVFD